MPLFPDTFSAADEEPNKVDSTALRTHLQALGFKPRLINKTIEFLDSPPPHTPYLSSLLAQPALDAALSHLLVTTDESELPKRFSAGNSNVTSEGFVSSTHAGSSGEDLPTRWMREKATKEAGWPEKSVSDAFEWLGKAKSWETVNEVLGRKLIGMDQDDRHLTHVISDEDMEERDARKNEEIEAVLAVYASAVYDEKSNTLSVQLGDPALSLHIVYSPTHPYLLPQQDADGLRAPPLYIVSPSTVPYIKLHLLSKLLLALYGTGGSEAYEDTLRSLLALGEGIVFSAIELLDDAWAQVQDVGPPDVGEVMKHLLPPPPPPSAVARVAQSFSKGRASEGRPMMDTRSNDMVLKEFTMMTQDPKYAAILDGRKSLPAWKSRDMIVELVNKSRVVVVIGEVGTMVLNILNFNANIVAQTGCGKTTQRTNTNTPKYPLSFLIFTFLSAPIHPGFGDT